MVKNPKYLQGTHPSRSLNSPTLCQEISPGDCFRRNMEEEDAKNSDRDLPPYSPFPSTKQLKKKWIVGGSVVFLLASITVVSTLVAVYTTPKHTEMMVKMLIVSQDGHNVQRAILVNEQEDEAVFTFLGNNSSSIYLLDYKQITLLSKLRNYNVKPTEEANRLHLGMRIKIMCSDVPIYWSAMMS